MDPLRVAADLGRAVERLAFHLDRDPRETAALAAAHSARLGDARGEWDSRRRELGGRLAAERARVEREDQARAARLTGEVERLPARIRPRVGVVGLVEMAESLLGIDLDWLKLDNPAFAAELDRLRGLVAAAAADSAARTARHEETARAELTRFAATASEELASLESTQRAEARSRAARDRRRLEQLASEISSCASALHGVVNGTSTATEPARLVSLAWVRVASGVGPIEFPALVRFPLDRPLVIRRLAGRSCGRAAAHQVVLRMLLAAPPGRVLLSAADPVGLGTNLAPFVSLKRGPSPVLSPIATSGDDVERLLQTLVDHVEHVIQDRLGDRYPTVEEYNRAVPELPVPYRVLILFDFPEQVTRRAAELLAALIRHGPRCGVSVVTEGAAPEDGHGLWLDVDADADGRSVGCSVVPEVLRPVSLVTAPPLPPPAALERLLAPLACAGADRADVDYPRLLREAELWEPGRALAGSTAECLEVPLGVAGPGAVRALCLGRGTAQHALVAGKSGAGKSNLLHVLLATAARRYPPEELELLLVDFKKGVEFQIYAEERLPQARVVAVESDRELGLAVLRRLRTEADRRGRLFRGAGCADIAAYRQTGAPLPRLLLVVDEFQLLLDPDDGLAQEARALLDHLVRQGRAFGIHLVLATQTLHGVWAALKSTLSQMAVRIALQCDDADSRLVLADNNPAAKALAQAGDAILNAACGQPDGNERFQVARLSRDVLVRATRFVRGAVEKRLGCPAPAPRVFDGREFPDPSANERFRSLVTGIHLPPDRCLSIPLGESDDLVGVVEMRLSPEAGQNVLLLGRPEAALRHQLATAALALDDPGVAEVVVFDPDGLATPALSGPSFGPRVRFLSRPVDVSAELTGLAVRLAQGGRAGRTVLLLLGLHRLSDLRQETVSPRPGAGPGPAAAFGELLHRGPENGVHTIAWAISHAALVRGVDPGRKLLRDFNHRVVFQVAEDDSLAALGTRQAAHLGEFAGLHLDAADNRCARFRPFRAVVCRGAQADPSSSSFAAS